MVSNLIKFLTDGHKFTSVNKLESHPEWQRREKQSSPLKQKICIILYIIYRIKFKIELQILFFDLSLLLREGNHIYGIEKFLTCFKPYPNKCLFLKGLEL